jgi:hypothetical protein
MVKEYPLQTSHQLVICHCQIEKPLFPDDNQGFLYTGFLYIFPWHQSNDKPHILVFDG